MKIETVFKLAIFVSLASIALSAPCLADDTAGIGALSCASYTKSYKKAPAAMESSVEDWTLGFFSGLNSAQFPKEKDLSSLVTKDGSGLRKLSMKINLFCDNHPLSYVGLSLIDIYKALPLLQQTK